MPLAYRGLGELFVVLFFGLIAVTGSAFVQSGQWHIEAVVAGLQVGMLSTVLIAINNLRDVDEDTKTGKRTLAVRFGKTFARWEIVGLYFFTGLLTLYWVLANWLEFSHWILPAVLIIKMSVELIRNIFKNQPSELYNSYLAAAGKLLIMCSVFMCCMFYLAKR
jgi:1,4-dihydroxy-2-naphthoate polyprenyltransferase